MKHSSKRTFSQLLRPTKPAFDAGKMRQLRENSAGYFGPSKNQNEEISRPMETTRCSSVPFEAAMAFRHVTSFFFCRRRREVPCTKQTKHGSHELPVVAKRVWLGFDWPATTSGPVTWGPKLHVQRAVVRLTALLTMANRPMAIGRLFASSLLTTTTRGVSMNRTHSSSIVSRSCAGHSACSVDRVGAYRNNRCGSSAVGHRPPNSCCKPLVQFSKSKTAARPRYVTLSEWELLLGDASCRSCRAGSGGSLNTS